MTVLENRDEFDQEARPAGLANSLNRAKLLLASRLDPRSQVPLSRRKLLFVERALVARLACPRRESPSCLAMQSSQYAPRFCRSQRLIRSAMVTIAFYIPR